MSDRSTTGEWREALDCVDELLSRPQEFRAEYLGALQRSRPAVYARVHALLQADREASQAKFLDVQPRRNGQQSAIVAGMTFGPYRIERELGKGGMGEVWLATRDDGLYQGQVAIKTLHPLFAAGALRDRLLREAGMLGRLTHPNIARLLDAGVNDGIVYLVLEYIRGKPIDRWCDDRKLDIEGRLKLFVEVCAAVAHAHANLIVHRDIKPSNILVTDAGQVKLLDFGIGKLVESDSQQGETELTRITGRIFTPAYAAPEQILGESVTTATDVYSLGVLFHLLLSGTRPYANTANDIDLQRAVLHDDPVPMGRAVVEIDSEEIAVARSSTLRRLRKNLSGDLNHIASRAMRKSPRGRYASVLGMSTDIERFLSRQPVEARAGSRAYRFGRFVQRHRTAVAAALVSFAAVIAGSGAALWQAKEAREQTRAAQMEAKKAEAVKTFLVDIFDVSSVNNRSGLEARKTTAEELLAIGSDKILKGLTEEPGVRVEIMKTLGDINLLLEDYPRVEALLKERVAYARTSLDARDARVAQSYLDLAVFLRQRNRFDEAKQAVSETIRLLDAVGDTSSPLRGRTEAQRGQIAFMTTPVMSREPLEHYQRALAILEHYPNAPERVTALLGYARSLEKAGLVEEAIDANLKGIDAAVAVSGPRATDVGGGHQQLARVLAKNNRMDEATEHLNKAVEIFSFLGGPTNGFTLGAQLDVARLQIRRGKHLDAVATLEPVLSATIAKDGADNYWVQDMRFNLAIALAAIGDASRAEALVAEALSTVERTKRNDLRMKLIALRSDISRDSNRLAASLADIEGAFDIAKQLSVPQYQLSTMGVSRALTIIAIGGRLTEARKLLEDSERIIVAEEKNPVRVDGMRVQLAFALADLSDRNADSALRRIRPVVEVIGSNPQRGEYWEVESLAWERQSLALAALGGKDEGCRSLLAAIAVLEDRVLPRHARKIRMQDTYRKTCRA